MHTRIKTFGDFLDLCDFFFINDLKTTKEMLCQKNTTPESIALLLQIIIWSLDEKGNWNGEALDEASRECAEIFGLHHKKVVIPALFASIMGKLKGPPLFDSVTLLGKDRSRARLMNAIEILGGVSNKKLSQLKKGWDKKDCRDMVNQKALQ